MSSKIYIEVDSCFARCISLYHQLDVEGTIVCNYVSFSTARYATTTNTTSLTNILLLPLQAAGVHSARSRRKYFKTLLNFDPG